MLTLGFELEILEKILKFITLALIQGVLMCNSRRFCC